MSVPVEERPELGPSGAVVIDQPERVALEQGNRVRVGAHRFDERPELDAVGHRCFAISLYQVEDAFGGPAEEFLHDQTQLAGQDERARHGGHEMAGRGLQCLDPSRGEMVGELGV